MFTFGDALANGVKGWERADAKREQAQDREYALQKRASDDAYMQTKRQRENKAYNQQQSEQRRLSEMRRGINAMLQGEMTGDMSGLTRFFQDNDTAAGANIAKIELGSDGNYLVTDSQGTSRPVNRENVINTMRAAMSPENWLNLEGERQMLSERTAAQKDINKAQGVITRENQTHQGGVQMDVADNASGNAMVQARHAAKLRSPDVVKIQNKDGTTDQIIYQGGKEIGRVTAFTPEMINAMKTKGGSGESTSQLDVDKFFAQLSAKQFGVPDSNGNLMLDEKNGEMKSKVEALASLMYREMGDQFTPLQHFAIALKHVRANPSINQNQAIQELRKKGVESPSAFFASPEEKQQYMDEVEKLINERSQVPMSDSQRGVLAQKPAGESPQTNGVKSPANIITEQVPSTFASKMQVGTKYSPSGGPFAGKTLVKLSDGSIQLIE